MNVSYRSPAQSDLAFIMSTWLKGQRHQGDRSFMTNRTYFDNEKKRIEKILSKSFIVIICDPEDSNHVFGYLAYNMLGDIFIIHYAHLKKAFRKLGLMSALLSELYPNFKKDEIAITHINELTANLRTKYILKFNPFLEGYFQ